MRRSLTWALGASALLSIAAIMWTSEAPRIVSAIEPRAREQMQALDSVSLAGTMHAAPLEPLPTHLTRLTLDPAKRDPFLPTAASAPAAVPAPTPVTTTVAAPPPPSPPPLTVRFLGSMVTPEGERLLYLARGDAAVQVKLGDRLDEGYVVESLTTDAVGLFYPPLSTRVSVPIPPEPKQ